MVVTIDFNLRSTDTQFDSFLDINKQSEALEMFKNEFGQSGSNDGSIESGVIGKAHIIAIIFDWDEWLADQSVSFDRDSFDHNATGTTSMYQGDDDEYEVVIFSDGDECSHFSGDYIEQLEYVLGYSPKANLDKVWMTDEESFPIVFEGDGFDILMAPRKKPGEME